MTLPKLAGSLAVLVVVGALAWMTTTLAGWRAAASEAAAPPLGQFVTVNGHKIHALIRGSGPDLILIHGASGNLRDFLPLIDLLAATYRVIAMDRPGLGWSDPSPLGMTLQGQAAILAQAAVLLGVTSPILLGQSYGGAVALAWGAQDTLRPRALVLVSAPALPWQGQLDIWYRTTHTTIGQSLAPPLAAAYVPKFHVDGILRDVFLPDPEPPGYGAMIGVGLSLRTASLRANAAQVNALHADLTRLQPHYPSLHIPVELVHGSADHIVPLAIHAQPLSVLLPNVTLTVLSAGHMPHHSHPAEVIAAITRAGLR